MRDVLTTIDALYPPALPLVCLAGSGRHVILALRFSEVAFAELAGRPLAQAAAGAAALFGRGYIGVLSYDRLAAPDAPAPGAAPARIFRVEQALVVDRGTGEVAVTGSPTAGSAAFAVPPAVIARLAAALRALAGGAPPPASQQGWMDAPSPRPAAAPDAGLTLTAEAPDEAYLRLVRCALEDIRAGRYYQVNLLRYFRVAEALDRTWLARRLDREGGPFAALLDVPGLTVASFSPERFVALTPRGGALDAEAYPIKGTAARAPDAAADAEAARALEASPKDRAELHMIVDLMRNDLNRVAVPGSVRVPEPGALVSVRSVHHLQARVTARLRPGLAVGELLRALCPGGSVTGAPKREVMAAIRSYEGRLRRYFMGHAFYLDDGGRFDSSLLIRTLVREGDYAYAFAAGSGIVIGSDPELERREIEAKCRVVTAKADP